MKFSDEVIAHIATALQMAIITGTDIVDHMRMMAFEESEGKLYLDKNYAENEKNNIEKLLELAVMKMSQEEAIEE